MPPLSTISIQAMLSFDTLDHTDLFHFLNVSCFTFLHLASALVPEVDEVQLHFMIVSERAKYEATCRSHVQLSYIIHIC